MFPSKLLKKFHKAHKQTGFRSLFEASLSKVLPEDAVYEPFRISYPIRTVAHYIPDWVLPTQCILIEAKGYFPAEQRTKMLRVKNEYPELDIRFIFQKDSKITPKMRQSDWCVKNGFPYAVGEVPEAWLAKTPTKAERELFESLLN